MFAVIGQKIYDRLKTNMDFRQSQGETISTEQFTNNTFVNTQGWFSTPAPPRYLSAQSGTLQFSSLDTINATAALFGEIYLYANTEYLLEYVLDGPYDHQIMFGSVPYSSSIYVSGLFPTENKKKGLTFATGPNDEGWKFITIAANNFGTASTILRAISLKKVTANSKITPVIIPQGASYPATVYEIDNVDNFLTKTNSLLSCDLSIRIACFADDYRVTYLQSKAVVEALDYYSVTYTEDGVSYTAKFRFDSLNDDYYKQPEKFYKNVIFNCLITKN